MQAPGVEAVDRAKANGQWESAYDSHRTAGVPDDLQRALDAHPEAKAFFATLNSANRYAILFRIQTVKRAETRAKKIQQFVGMLERHDGQYSNTPETDLFLDRAKPSYSGGFLEMSSMRLYRFWADLTEGLRTGEPQNEAKTGGNLFDVIYRDPALLKEMEEYIKSKQEKK